MPGPPAFYDIAPGLTVLRFVGFGSEEIHIRVKQTTLIKKATRQGRISFLISGIKMGALSRNS